MFHVKHCAPSSGAPLADQVIEQIETATGTPATSTSSTSDVERARKCRSDLDCPIDLDYAAVRALSFEARQVLAAHRPETLAAAARLPGVTPAAISLLLVHVKKHRRTETADDAAPVLPADA